MPNPAAPANLARYDTVSLRLYIATVRSGSLTAGAEQFGISLAAASKRMAELEGRCGHLLLERSKRGVRPTLAGQTLLRHALETVGSLERLALAMDDLRRGAGGHLRLWANTSAFAGFLPGLLADYSRRFPTVAIDLEDALSDDAVQAVLRGMAELAVIGDNTPHKGLVSVVCDSDRLVLVVPRGHRFAGLDAVPIEMAAGEDMIGLGRSTSLMRQVAAAAEAAGRSLRVRAQVRSFDAMCRMVSAGMGIAILPSAGARPHLRSMGLVALALEGFASERSLLLAMRSPDTLSEAGARFVALARRRAGS
jgi:DNA-binding transcriptional LysR family regulator